MTYDPGSGAIVPATAADARAAVAYLRTPLAIRVRAANVLEAGLLGELRHFAVARDRIDAVAERVIAVTRAAYPNLRIPVRGRLGHFRTGGLQSGRADPLRGRRWRRRRRRADRSGDGERGLRAPGAGNVWRYREAATGQELTRSEGLAVASLRAFEAGLFSADPLAPLVDAAALRQLDDADLARALQVDADNPLIGLAGRAALLRRLGEVLDASSARFPGGRPSGLVHALRARGPRSAPPTSSASCSRASAQSGPAAAARPASASATSGATQPPAAAGRRPG